jgi:hypothetical protein
MSNKQYKIPKKTSQCPTDSAPLLPRLRLSCVLYALRFATDAERLLVDPPVRRYRLVNDCSNFRENK